MALVAAKADASDTFWAAADFRPTGEQMPYRYNRVESVSAIHRRLLTPQPGARTQPAQESAGA